MKSQEENSMSNNERPPQYQQPVVHTVPTGYPVNCINMIPVNNGMGVINTMQLAGQSCFHPNLMLNYTYDSCALACIILLCVMWFPLGLCALLALDSAKNYTCPMCGHKQAGGSRICIYVTFGILTAAAIAVYAVIIYYAVLSVTVTEAIVGALSQAASENNWESAQNSMNDFQINWDNTISN